MKYAVIGTGKTGHTIIDLLPKTDIVAVCNSKNPATKEKVKGADVGIVFVPGNVMGGMLPVLLDLGIPLVIGTTGFEWPKTLDQQLKAKNTAWILGRNFSISLNVMRYYAERIKKSLLSLNPKETKLSISETHHIHKIDAPSGTAIYIANALGVPQEQIESIREGDAKGLHTVTFDWPGDRILLTHEALDRKPFGEGAILAATHIKNMRSGLHDFEKLADTLIENGLKG